MRTQRSDSAPMSNEHFEIKFFLGLLLCALALVVLVFLPALNAIVLGLTFAVLFHPLYTKLRKVMSKREWLAALTTVIVAVIVILVPLTFFGVKIVGEAEGLYTRLTSGAGAPLLESLHGGLQRVAPWLDVDPSQYVKQVLEIVIANVGSVLSGFASVVGTFLLAFFILFYLLKDGAAIGNTITRVSQLSRDRTDEILSKLRGMANSVLKGSLVISVIEGIAVGVGFWIFGLPNPALWGLISIVVALVPVVGIALIVVPAAIFMIFEGNIVAMIGFVVWILLVVALMENVLRPRFISRSTKVHPLLVLLSVLGGISFFGAMGFILGPLVLSFFLALLEIFPAIISGWGDSVVRSGGEE